MPSILVSVVCACWATGFVLRAADVAGLGGAWLPQIGSAATFAAVACTLVAALFLWAAAASITGFGNETADITAMAASMALVTLTWVAPAAANMPAGQLSLEQGVHVSALCATFLLVKSVESAGAPLPTIHRSREQARRLAIGAAHGSMLARFSRRGPDNTGSGV